MKISAGPDCVVIPDASRSLLAVAARGLREARAAVAASDRYSGAHVAALRAAAAVVAVGNPGVRPLPAGAGGAAPSVWDLLARAAPEFREWAGFFAAGSGKRSAVEAGLPVVTARDADDLVRDAERFLHLVVRHLGATRQAGVALHAVPA